MVFELEAGVIAVTAQMNPHGLAIGYPQQHLHHSGPQQQQRPQHPHYHPHHPQQVSAGLPIAALPMRSASYLLTAGQSYNLTVWLIGGGMSGFGKEVAALTKSAHVVMRSHP